MFPVICQIGPLSIYSYGLMLAVAVVLCSILMAKDAKRLNISKEEIHDFIFWVVVSGIVGARLFFIILNLEFFLESPKEIVMLQHGGLAWQGGLTLGSLGAFLFVRKKRWKFFEVADLAAPYLALGQSIGRIGCFLNGCCYGKEWPWGIYFPSHQAHLYPTQLFDSLGLFVVFLLLRSLSKKERIPGKIFVMYLWMAAALRFAVEFFRADHDNIFWGLSIYQLICLAIIVLGVYCNAQIYRHRRER